MKRVKGKYRSDQLKELETIKVGISEDWNG